jgi:hypothetical protein
MTIKTAAIEGPLNPTNGPDSANDEEATRTLKDKSTASAVTIEFLQDDEKRWHKIFQLLANENNQQ